MALLAGIGGIVIIGVVVVIAVTAAIVAAVKNTLGDDEQ